MSDEETRETVVALTEEERLYQEAKRRYNRAGKSLDEAEEALEQWKAEHGDDNDRFRELEQRVNNAAHVLQITDQALQNAERRRKDARAAAEILVEPARRIARVGLSTLNSRIKSLYSFASKLSVDLPDEHCDEFKHLEDWKVEERLMVAFFAELRAKRINCLILDEAQKNLELVEFLVKSPGADRLGTCRNHFWHSAMWNK